MTVKKVILKHDVMSSIKLRSQIKKNKKLGENNDGRF